MSEKLKARPWEPQDLLDALQAMIDGEPDNYTNERRDTLCMARDYLKECIEERILREDSTLTYYEPGLGTCKMCGHITSIFSIFCPNCGRRFLVTVGPIGCV